MSEQRKFGRPLPEGAYLGTVKDPFKYAIITDKFLNFYFRRNMRGTSSLLDTLKTSKMTGFLRYIYILLLLKCMTLFVSMGGATAFLLRRPC